MRSNHKDVHSAFNVYVPIYHIGFQVINRFLEKPGILFVQVHSNWPGFSFYSMKKHIGLLIFLAICQLTAQYLRGSSMVVTVAGNEVFHAGQTAIVSFKGEILFVPYHDILSHAADSIPEGGISAFPNPAHEFFTLSFPKARSVELRLKIFDMIGKEVLTQNLSTAEDTQWKVDISNLRKGMYLLRLTDGEQQYTRRIIVN